jgi:uncharacterized protein (TIGR02301 family)
LAQDTAPSAAETPSNGAINPLLPPPPPAPDPGEPTLYDPELIRLSTILGSLHYLRNLCGEPGDEWRGRMEGMLIADKMEGERRARAIAAFNDGYKAFAETYFACNTQAAAAISRFQAEGETLTARLLTRFRS